MSELRSVIAFFLGLVFFIVLIGLAIGRIRLPGRNQQTALVPTVTPTPTIAPTRKPGILDRIASIFRRTTPTPTMSTTLTTVPTSTMQEAIDPSEVNTGSRVVTTKGGQVVNINDTNVQSIPDSGAPTLLLPLSMLLGGLGFKLRKRS